MKGRFSVEELELDEIRPNEARVRLVATGVCHTDMVIRDAVYPYPLPAVLGHEGGGIVEAEAVGRDVTRVRVGDHVVLSAAYCTQCLQCLTGHMAYCENLFAQDFGGRRADGTTSLTVRGGEVVSSHFFGQSSFSTYANVVESSLVPVDPSAPLETIAPLGCGMQTGAGSILNELRPPAGSAVAISGTGAVGHAAVMAARASGCTTIIATDLHDNRLGLAGEVGATHTINARAGAGHVKEEILRITGGKGVNYILDTTGLPDMLVNLAGALAIRGTLATVGAAAPGTVAPSRSVSRSPRAGPSRPWLVELWKRG